MDPIPSRLELENMTKTEVKDICKRWGIKASISEDRMIYALCRLANGEEVPRAARATSFREASSLFSHGAGKAPEGTLPKQAIPPSESDTGAVSVPDVSVPTVHTTRSRARAAHSHLGKGRPVLAGGSGARAVTRRKTQASGAVARRRDTILEEEEEANDNITLPAEGEPLNAQEQLSIPAQQSAQQVATIDARFSQLETAASAPPVAAQDPTILARLLRLEERVAAIPALEAAIAVIPALEAAVATIPALEARTERLATEFERVVAERDVLRERVSELEEAKHEGQGSREDDDDSGQTDAARPATPTPLGAQRVGSMIVHPPVHEDVPAKPAAPHTPLAAQAPVAKKVPAIPSPAQAVLGKHARVETAEADKTTDSEVALRPVRKRARVDSVRIENPPVIFPQAGPSFTSTPKRSYSSLAFFTGGRRAPTPLARSSEEEDFESDSYFEDKEEVVAGPSKPVVPEAGPSNARFCSGSLPFLLHSNSGNSYASFPASSFPPLAVPAAPAAPATPPGMSIEMHGSPDLDAPWQHMGTPAPPKPVYAPIYGPDSLQSPLAAPEPGFIFRGGRNERNDRYNPFPTPGSPHRTGLTPLLRPTLRSPVTVEGKEAGGKLRTLYGTEIDRDTRFGDGGYGPWRRQ